MSSNSNDSSNLNTPNKILILFSYWELIYCYNKNKFGDGGIFTQLAPKMADLVTFIEQNVDCINENKKSLLFVNDNPNNDTTSVEYFDKSQFDNFAQTFKSNNINQTKNCTFI